MVKTLLVSFVILMINYDAPKQSPTLIGYLGKWNQYKNQQNFNFGKFDFIRRAIFMYNYEKMVSHNNLNKSQLLGLTQFSHITNQEFRQRNNLQPNNSKKLLKKSALPKNKVNQNNPATVDWRDQGVLTPVKDQGQCGSCWAFSATETIESREKILNNKPLKVLSPQQLVDCENQQNGGQDAGCGGGLMEHAFDWLSGKGMPLESSLPYTGANGSCPTVEFEFKNISGHTSVGNTNEALEEAVAVGPVSIGVNASGETWQLYHGGVVNYSDCSGDILDHGVQLVGQKNGQWVVRNSWAASWGEEGYIYLEKGEGKNTCGLLNDPTFPLFKN